MEMKRIGEYLIEQQKVTPKQIERALEIQASRLQDGHMPPIGTILIEMGAVKEHDITFALERQERDRMRVTT